MPASPSTYHRLWMPVYVYMLVKTRVDAAHLVRGHKALAGPSIQHPLQPGDLRPAKPSSRLPLGLERCGGASEAAGDGRMAGRHSA